MIGLVIQLTRLCFGVLTLMTRLLASLVDQIGAMLDRRTSTSGKRTSPETTMQHEARMPSRRRAFVAPPRRARRSGQ